MFLPANSLTWFLCYSFYVGFSISSSAFMGYAMLVDIIDLDLLRSGPSKAGLFFSLSTLVDKISIGVAVAGANLVLAYLGFDPASGDIPPDIGTYFRQVIGFSQVTLNILALMVLACYPLTSDVATHTRQALNQRAAARAATISSGISVAQDPGLDPDLREGHRQNTLDSERKEEKVTDKTCLLTSGSSSSSSYM